MALLIGAGGDGKSTVLRQIAVDLVEAGKRVLFRVPGTPLDGDAIAALPPSEAGWILATDDADEIAWDLEPLIERLIKDGRRDIHWLLTARDSDWNAEFRSAGRSVEPQWDRHVEVWPRRMARAQALPLTAEDATGIVVAWESADSLGDLAAVAADERAAALLETAQALPGQSLSGGTLLGAALERRLGTEGLSAHVRVGDGAAGRLRQGPARRLHVHRCGRRRRDRRRRPAGRRRPDRSRHREPSGHPPAAGRGRGRHRRPRGTAAPPPRHRRRRHPAGRCRRGRRRPGAGVPEPGAGHRRDREDGPAPGLRRRHHDRLAGAVRPPPAHRGAGRAGHQDRLRHRRRGPAHPLRPARLRHLPGPHLPQRGQGRGGLGHPAGGDPRRAGARGLGAGRPQLPLRAEPVRGPGRPPGRERAAGRALRQRRQGPGPDHHHGRPAGHDQPGDRCGGDGPAQSATSGSPSSCGAPPT